MKTLQQRFSVPFQYEVHFTRGLFDVKNPLLTHTIRDRGSQFPAKTLFVIDSGVAKAHHDLIPSIRAYVTAHGSRLCVPAEPLVVPGGESAKNDPELVERILQAINDHGIDRHSFVIGIGGGAVLDMVGYAAATGHRGIRHIRVPTTVLSQNDSGVGVKNGINYFGKKNFLGTFAPPVAVLNDLDFLRTLHIRDWRAGISEAIKVALIKEASFFTFLEENATRLANRDEGPMERLIHDCARLHMEHIAGGDPFEMGSSRPLDFGHWAAHKLEQLTAYRLRHGEAVAIGIALDVTYSYLNGMIQEADWKRVLHLIQQLGFDLYTPELSSEQGTGWAVIAGLEEFREHLGGQLTIMLLEGIGIGREVHEMDHNLLIRSIRELERIHQNSTIVS